MKPVRWVGSSHDDLRRFPREVQSEVGYALYVAQIGGKHQHAKPLTGFGAGVLEMVENSAGDTYRAVYTVRFSEAIYVLHCFQKKSPHGIKTAKPDLDLIRARLLRAQEMHEQSGG